MVKAHTSVTLCASIGNTNYSQLFGCTIMTVDVDSCGQRGVKRKSRDGFDDERVWDMKQE
jgi:hypothetical protein